LSDAGSDGPASERSRASTFDVLGNRFRIEADAADLLRPFEQLFAHFRSDDDDEVPGPALLALRGNQGTEQQALCVREHSFAVPGSADDLIAHAYAVLLNEVFAGVEGYLLLHAAALEFDGGGLVLSGASGAGKTSLACELARGAAWKFLSDDVAPIDSEEGRLHPFPKALSIRPGLVDSDQLDGERLPVLEGGVKTIIDPGSSGLTLATGSCPLRTLVFLEPHARALHPDTAPLAVVIHRTVPGLVSRLRQLPDARSVVERTGHRFVTLDIDTKVPARTLAQVEEICREERALIIGTAREAQRAEPDFLAEPELEPISLDDSVRLFLRRLWGVAQYKQLAAYGGGARLYLAIARLLGEVDCYRLRPGRFEAEVALIKEAVGDA
jgi:hypothetical protein